MTPTLEVFAMMQFTLLNGEKVTRPVRLIGVDPEGRTAIGGFKEYLVYQHRQDKPSFEITGDALRHYEWRTRQLQLQVHKQAMLGGPQDPQAERSQPSPPPVSASVPHGIIVGNLLASYRDKDDENPGKYKDNYVLHPGDEVIIYTLPGVISARPEPVYDAFVVVDYFKSEMSEYDSNYVFVPLDYLQHLRTMEGRATSIEIKLKDYRHASEVVDELKKMFPRPNFMVQTWEAKQGPLLAAISIERGILNLLLFMIIGVAGFGILAIFSMIVVEKTRDIGILKALGASNRGVMSIFLGYGLLLGVVGAGLGSALGLTITVYINEIENVLTKITGQELFDRTVYYFDKIPTDIQISSVLLVNLGALAIAVLASVLPALRAALLHPVRALRYE